MAAANELQALPAYLLIQRQGQSYDMSRMTIRGRFQPPRALLLKSFEHKLLTFADRLI